MTTRTSSDRPSSISYGVGMALYFGIVWGTIMWFFVWRHQDMPASVSVGAASFAGIFFGTFMGYLHHRRHRKTAKDEQ